MKSVMSHSFSGAPAPMVQRSTFDRSHGYKTTFNGGQLVPFYVDEVLPGDSFSLSASHFCRTSTPLVPVMDNAKLTFFYFYVPCRLVWDNFNRFMGEQRNPEDSTDYLVPNLGSFANGNASCQRLADYFGIMTTVKGTPSDDLVPFPKGINALPFRAYNLIWNEWFRDENLQDSIPVLTGDGPDGVSAYKLRRRGKRHDYFTSALPWPQKGFAVELPLGTSAPLKMAFESYDKTDLQPFLFSRYDSDGVTYPGNQRIMLDAEGANVSKQGTSDNRSLSDVQAQGTAGAPSPYNAQYDLVANPDFFRVDLSEATAATVNALREAFQLQRMFERDARGGTRYTEIVLSHFGVHSPDSRLQRPEYLGGGMSFINYNPVTQQSATDGTTPQGNLAAYGTTGGKSGFKKSFTEHGYIIGLMCATADLTYQQGINRMWTRRTRFDFYWPTLAHLGEQPVYNYEIFNDRSTVNADLDTTVFGYQERYAEYRYKPSMITGLFNSDRNDSLDIWHFSQKFSQQPLLNSDFIEENPPFNRSQAVPSEPTFIIDLYLNLKCARPMPVYSVPGLIDHF